MLIQILNITHNDHESHVLARAQEFIDKICYTFRTAIRLNSGPTESAFESRARVKYSIGICTTAHQKPHQHHFTPSRYPFIACAHIHIHRDRHPIDYLSLRILQSINLSSTHCRCTIGTSRLLSRSLSSSMAWCGHTHLYYGIMHT